MQPLVDSGCFSTLLRRKPTGILLPTTLHSYTGVLLNDWDSSALQHTGRSLCLNPHNHTDPESFFMLDFDFVFVVLKLDKLLGALTLYQPWGPVGLSGDHQRPNTVCSGVAALLQWPPPGFQRSRQQCVTDYRSSVLLITEHLHRKSESHLITNVQRKQR